MKRAAPQGRAADMFFLFRAFFSPARFFSRSFFPSEFRSQLAAVHMLGEKGKKPRWEQPRWDDITFLIDDIFCMLGRDGTCMLRIDHATAARFTNRANVSLCSCATACEIDTSTRSRFALHDVAPPRLHEVLDGLAHSMGKLVELTIYLRGSPSYTDTGDLALADDVNEQLAVESLTDAVEASAHQLRRLDVANCGLCASDIMSMCRHLARATSMRHLGLRDNHLADHIGAGRECIATDLGAKAVAVALSCMTSLTVLDISGNELGNPYSTPPPWQQDSGSWEHADGRLLTNGVPSGSVPSAVKALATGIAAAPNLRVLSLARNSLLAAGAAAIAPGLRGHPRIQDMDISSNALTYDGFQKRDVGPWRDQLAPALLSMSALKRVRICGNSIRCAEASLVTANGELDVCRGSAYPAYGCCREYTPIGGGCRNRLDSARSDVQ